MARPRLDGRQQGELRRLQISFEKLDRVDGSASFGFGDTKVIASVSGPIEVRLANEQASHATFEVVVRPLSDLPGTESRSLASTIRSVLVPSLILSQNPRTLIQLVVQLLTPMPSHHPRYALIAATINASTLALLNSGSVPMFGVVFAVAIGHLRSTPPSQLVVDPGEDEASLLEYGGAFAFLFSTNPYPTSNTAPLPSPSCAAIWSDWQTTTRCREDELIQARELAQAAASRLWLQCKQFIESGCFGAGPHKKLLREPATAQTGPTVRTVGAMEDDDQMEI